MNLCTGEIIVNHSYVSFFSLAGITLKPFKMLSVDYVCAKEIYLPSCRENMFIWKMFYWPRLAPGSAQARSWLAGEILM